jgi:opacity protein-like surface antigen
VKKLDWRIVLVAAAVALISVPVSQAQTSVYAEGTANFLDNGPYTDFLSGGTAGVLIDVAQIWKDRITFSADIQGNFVYSNTRPANLGPAYSEGETFDAVTVGPRLSLAPHFFKLAPYVQANIGFARYHDPLTHSATDNLIGGQAGVTRRLTSHFDALVDYSYSRFGYDAAYYNPQTFSVGVIYHFAKR